MSVIGDVLKELVSMFVADARLTLAILVLVATVAAMRHVFPAISPLTGGWILLAGCLVITIAVTALHAQQVKSKGKS
ncbi:hypothetical protein ELH75_36790 [Rhizobium leguminosarum]|uniref:hypothetical protein n=1 Tax=Rhizobium leguminosarum TaxID=384 RepID=UPI0010310338|nr:hypothetical protein [Rhizobium leguminosarum]TAZ44274.1 hypothetical protein ELH75_36790 [Rhizobium leguminosarum]